MAGHKTSRIGRAITLGLLGLTVSAPSHAYLDPGTGSIILQSILAGIAVAMGVLRLYWHRFKSFIGSITGSSSDASGDGEADLAQDADINNES